MPLFASDRDARLITSINREITHRFLSIEVELYKIALPETNTNLYGESSKKVYYSPMRFYALINKDLINMVDADTGIDVTQTVQFQFLRQDLVECGYVIEEGDIIKFDERYYEVDNARTAQYWAGRNPQTFLMNTEGTGNRAFGYNVAIVAQTHLTRINNLHLVESRTGVNDIKTSNNLPKNL